MPISSSPRLLVNGLRPTETSTLSAEIVTSPPPSAGVIINSTEDPFVIAFTTFVLRENFIPCFSRILVNCEPTSESNAGTILLKYSITVTSAPNLLHTEPNSRPIYPPPMTTKCFGTDAKSNAPLEDTMFFSSTSIPGRVAISEPVAIRMFFVLYDFPSTSIVVADVILAFPIIC